MRFVNAYSHHNAKAEWDRRDLFEWLTDVFDAPNIKVEKRSTPTIREHIRTQFDSQGWSGEARIDSTRDLTVFSIKDDLAFQVQTGNISRALYDLLKLQFLFSAKKIDACALAVPSSIAAQKIGSNISNYNRLHNELQLFDRVISVPLLLISFE